MTAKQAEVWSLYKSGHRVVDIARITGRSKGNVSDTIKLIKTRMQNPPVKKSVTCPHSASCFTCPLKDCAIEACMAPMVNII